MVSSGSRVRWLFRDPRVEWIGAILASGGNQDLGDIGVQVVGSDVFSVVNPPSFPLQLEKGKSITIQVTCASVNAPR